MTTDPAYEGYRAWKQWDRLFDPQDHEAVLFEKEFRGVAISGKRWIDIGFGSGALLGWARAKGASIAGIEVQEDLLNAAAANGVMKFDSLDSVPAKSFDIITAFDVLEHIPREQLIAFLTEVRRIAAHDATIVFRVPNCQSAAGLLNQFGDATHVTMLSGPIVEKLCNDAQLKVSRIREAVDIVLPIPLPWRLLRPIQLLIRMALRKIMRIMLAAGTIPLSANVIIFAHAAD